MKIAVAGTGYVGLSMAILLAQHNEVYALDLIQEKVPAAEREALPLLADGSHILWVIGHRISSAAKVTESTEKVLQIYLRGGKENG